MSKTKNISEAMEDYSIDIVALLKQVYKNRKMIIFSAIIGAILGVIIALSTPNSYTSGSTFIPQTGGESKSSSRISGLASLAGINLGGAIGDSDIPPTLYPQIVSSIPYRLELLEQTIEFEGEEISLKRYLRRDTGGSVLGMIKKYTIGLPTLLMGALRGSTGEESKRNLDVAPYSITDEDQKLFNLLKAKLVLSLNEEEGFITLEFSDENKLIAAQVAEYAKEILQERIIDFKSQAARELLIFTNRQFEENKASFEHLQDSIAVFKDQNLNISSSLYQNRLDRLVSELSIVSSVVEQLATQLEQAKLQVNKDTPVFTVIEPVTIPFLRSAPNRMLIVVSWALIGVIVSISLILLKDPVKNFVSSFKD